MSNLMIISQLLDSKFHGNFIIGLLGSWERIEFSGGAQSVPVSGSIFPTCCRFCHDVLSGLCYYLTQPASFFAMFDDPLHGFLYITFMLASCALFSRAWISVCPLIFYHIFVSLSTRAGVWLVAQGCCTPAQGAADGHWRPP